MKLSGGQMQALSRAAEKSFEDRMFAHVSKHFQKRCSRLGEEGVREWIRHGMDRARSYDIVSERDVCKYIDVMFVYGRDYDTSPKHPWAGKVLNDPRRMSPTARANRLVAAGKLNARRAGGLGGWKRR